MLWSLLLLACSEDCEPGTHEEDGECVEDAPADTDVWVDPCEAASWCLSGTMTLTNVADTVAGQENTRAFDGLEDVPITVHIGFEADENFTEEDPKRARRIESHSVRAWFDPDPKGVLNGAAATSMAAGQLEFFLVGDQPDGTVLLDGPVAAGDPSGEEVFQLRFTGGPLEQTAGDFPELLPFSIAGTRVELARLVDVDAETDFGSGTADLTLASRP